MGKRDEVRRENKDINRPVLFNRINFMAVYLIGIYLPYILYLSVKFDIAEISLSRIGWRMNGFPFLLVYCGLTIPVSYTHLDVYKRQGKCWCLKTYIRLSTEVRQMRR